ncbi:LysR family transcriptional regulator [Eubacteriaceae bacterium ES3]|nr:LysR family transcriptional regulator [Eubacteriaceae bacterium ES3]
MNIQLAYSFITLCQYKNISLACNYLNISQQGLSKQIKTLEDELNVSLFIRSRVGVELTDYAKKLEPLFYDIVDSYENIIQIVSSPISAELNEVIVGIAQGVTSAIGLDFVADFNKEYSDIRLKLVELYDDPCEQALITGELDFAFLVNPVYTSRLEMLHIYEASACAIISKDHPYAKTKTELYLKDLDNQPIMIVDKNYVLRREFDEKCKEIGCSPNIHFTTSNIASYINLPNDIPSISIGASFFEQYISTENCTIVPLLDAPTYNVYFCTAKTFKSENYHDKFSSFIKKYF